MEGGRRNQLGPRLTLAPGVLVAGGLVVESGSGGEGDRPADAMGADAAILAGESVDPHNGKCVRASAGSLFHVPVARERDTDAVLRAIADAGIQILATAADGEVDLGDADELLAAPTAWLFGNEAHGLDPAVAARADHHVVESEPAGARRPVEVQLQVEVRVAPGLRIGREPRHAWEPQRLALRQGVTNVQRPVVGDADDVAGPFQHPGDARRQ
mgnify:CR=1 FL=1